jgi:uncharacterized protein
MQRISASRLKNHIYSNKILLLLGPKGIEKEAFVLSQIEEKEDFISFNMNDKKERKSFEESSLEEQKTLFQQKRFVYIEDAQNLVSLQQIIESILGQDDDLTLIASCSFEPQLDDVLREALQQAGLEITLFPYLFQEIANAQGLVDFDKNMEQRLIYGSYPSVFKFPEHADAFLVNLLNEAIFTHLSPNERINKEEKLFKMLQIIAFEMGEPISYNEIGFQAGLDNETVERYILLLEKAHILLRLPSFYNGHKYELKKTNTIFFLDNGIRNAIIRNFHPMSMRNDAEQLWKNWIISERFKWNKTNNNSSELYFWRTHTRQQMDLVEVQNGVVQAYVCQWDKRRKVKIPTSFKNAYPTATAMVLNRATYWGFLSK